VQRYLFQHKIHKFIPSLFETQEFCRKFIGVGHGLIPQDSTTYDRQTVILQEICRTVGHGVNPQESTNNDSTTYDNI